MSIALKDNRFVLLSDYTAYDLKDPTVAKATTEETLSDLEAVHGVMLKAVDSPIKLFDMVIGIRKDGAKSSQIGKTNWNNLFLIRKDFDYFLAFLLKDGEKILLADSVNGMFWNFNVVCS